MANAATPTYPGRTMLWQRMKGAGTEAKNIKWGTVPPSTSLITGSANPNVGLFQPSNESGVAGTSSLFQSANGFLADTYYVSGTLTCLTGAKTITEAVLSDTVSNAATTSLATSMTAAATTMSLSATSSFPGSAGFSYYAQVENETVLVTAGQGTTALTVVRAQLGSTSAIHGAGCAITVGGDGGASGWGLGSQGATPASVFGGQVFAHADFSGIPLNVNDSILFSFFDTLT